jgi:hypothetical protein
METRFKIGDIICAKLFSKPSKRFVVVIEDIIFKEKTINKYWFGYSKYDMKVSKSYVVRDVKHPWYYCVSFICENEFDFYENILN